MTALNWGQLQSHLAAVTISPIGNTCAGLVDLADLYRSLPPDFRPAQLVRATGGVAPGLPISPPRYPVPLILGGWKWPHSPAAAPV